MPGVCPKTWFRRRGRAGRGPGQRIRGAGAPGVAPKNRIRRRGSAGRGTGQGRAHFALTSRCKGLHRQVNSLLLKQKRTVVTKLYTGRGHILRPTTVFCLSKRKAIQVNIAGAGSVKARRRKPALTCCISCEGNRCAMVFRRPGQRLPKDWVLISVCTDL